MWKYVSRCIKDTVERPCNILAASSSSYPVADENRTPHITIKQKLRESCPIRNRIIQYRHQQNARRQGEPKLSTSSSSTDGDEDDANNKKRFDYRGYQCNFQKNVVEAITWSSAILCGWYTTQLLSVRRRHLATFRYNSSSSTSSQRGGLHSDSLVSTASSDGCQKLQLPGIYFKCFFSNWARTAPAFPSRSAWPVSDGLDWKQQEQIYEVSNETNVPLKQNDSHPTTTATSEKRAITVESAVQDLYSVIGDIEFQLGVRSIDHGDYALAASHFKMATSHRHANATFNLGICYEEGLGVDRNMKMALECYQAAADLGHPKATYNVGIFYVHGLAGLKRDHRMARKYFITAAQLGQIEAHEALGIRNFKNESKYSIMLSDIKQQQRESMTLTLNSL